MDRMFDILNSHYCLAKGFKQPLNRGNIDYTEKILLETMAYLEKLRLGNNSLVSKSRRKTFIVGFKTSAVSFISLGRQLFEKNEDVRFLLAYKLGQDHIEMLFSKLRSKGGYNNNPDVVQFRTALKSLMVKTEVSPSSTANCLELENDSEILMRPKAKKPAAAEDDSEECESIETMTIDIDLNQTIEDVVEYIGKPNQEQFVMMQLFVVNKMSFFTFQLGLWFGV